MSKIPSMSSKKLCKLLEKGGAKFVRQGKTEQESVVNIKDAIKQCLEVRSEKGMPLTVSMREVEVLV